MSLVGTTLANTFEVQTASPQGSVITKSNSFAHLVLEFLKISKCTIVKEAQRIQICHSFQY